MKPKLIIIIPIFILINNYSFAQTPACNNTGCDYTISHNVTSWDAAVYGVDEGETVYIEGDANGERNQLIISNLSGSAGNEIIVRPCNDLVTFSTSVNYCINFIDCEYFIFTGDGIPNEDYGIKLELDGGTNSAVGISTKNGSSDFVIEQIEITHGSFVNNDCAGILSNPQALASDQSTWGEYTGLSSGTGFIQKNITIRNNYIHHIGGVALYIGSTAWDIKNTTTDYEYEDPYLENVTIYNNRCEFFGKDGIQVSSAKGTNKIYDNHILYGGLNGQGGQGTGIWLGGGTRNIDIYNNIVKKNLGSGIGGKPWHDVELFNNLIIESGTDFTYGTTSGYVHGIWLGWINNTNCSDNIYSDAKFSAYNNNIISTKTDGVKLSGQTPAHFYVINNIIVNPGSGNYVNFENPVGSYTQYDDINYKTDDINDVRFYDALNYNYMIKPTSPAYNTGTNTDAPTFDFEYTLRPQCNITDIGAYERESTLNIWGNCLNETSVAASVIIHKECRLNKGDMIGGFYRDNGEFMCAGVIDWKDNTDTLIVYGEDSTGSGFTENEKYTWIVWDSAYNESHIYYADYDPDYPQTDEFEEDGISKILELYQQQEIILDSGWNIFSTFIDPLNDSIENILEEIDQNVIRVEDYTSYYTPNPYYNSLLTIETGKAYKINMGAKDTLIVKGLALRPENTPVPLTSTSPDWILLGYLMQSDELVEPILEPIVSNVTIIKDENGIVYWPQYNINYLVTMETGEGYEIQMSGADTLTYPANPYNGPSKTHTRKVNPQNFVCHIKTNNNLSLGISDNSWNIKPMYGDEVGVFDSENMLVGSAVYQLQNLAVTVWGDDPTTSMKDGLYPGEEFHIRLLHIANGGMEELVVEKWLSGNAYYQTNNVAITGKVNRPQTSINPYYLSQNYPNPFSKTSTINYYLPENSHVKILVHNVFGKVCGEYIVDKQPEGYHTFIFGSDNLNPGTYFYTLITPGFIQTRKMSIIK